MNEAMKAEKGLLEEVRAAAALAKLTFSPEEEARMSQELAGILSFAAALGQADTRDVPITAHTVTLKSVLRDDVVIPPFAREEMLMNAPARTEAFINVPKAFEEGGAEG